MKKPVELVQGTLDMPILKAVSLGGLHGYGVLLRLQQLTNGQLQIQQGAKFYTPTAAGRRKLKAETQSWNRFSMVVASVLDAIPERS